MSNEYQAISEQREEVQMKTMFSESVEVTTSPCFQKNCTRCSGQMTYEMCTDLQSDSGRSNFWAFRCIQCGDIVDEVILQNRSRSVFRPKAVLAVEAAACLYTPAHHREWTGLR